MILLIDNYDSFTYNLYQYIGEIDEDILVRRNDRITPDEVDRLNPKHIVISPGPGHPANAGVSTDLVKRFSGQIPILGICLGHQAIALAMGGDIGHSLSIVHGKQSVIGHTGKGVFEGIPDRFSVVRYHSLAVLHEGFPACLQIDAYADDMTIMALSHRKHLTFGLQFHPESILSEYGKELIRNFLNMGQLDER